MSKVAVVRSKSQKALRRGALLFAVSCLMARSASPCGTVCIPPHNEVASANYYSMSTGQPFRLAGFGVAVADHEVANCEPGDNPAFESATLAWKDFRFYAKLPGLPGSGIVKGTLNKAQNSGVVLTANDFQGNGGLYPASLLNKVYLRLLPVDFPAIEYRNVEPVTLYALNTWSAPPDSAVITHQQGEVVFALIGPALPGVPPTITFSGGEQRFLDAVAIHLSLLSANGGLVEVELSNPLSQQVLVAYFLHLDDIEPLADLVEPLDGVRTVAAGGQTVLSFDLRGIPIGNKNVMVDAMVLDPVGVAGHDRLEFHLPVSSGPSSSSPGSTAEVKWEQAPSGPVQADIAHP